MMGAATREVLADADAVAARAAALVVELATAAIASRGCFTLALSGGSTPRRLYQQLAAAGTAPPSSPANGERIDWSRVFCVQGDERAVPPEHADSNFRMQRETLLEPLQVPAAQVVRFHAEDPELDPDAVARRFEADLCRTLAIADGEWPVLDLVLLGLGADGHTASLFPGSPALLEPSRIAVANPVGPPIASLRYTLTAAAINHARAVLFLVAGADKAAALAEVLAGEHRPQQFPAQMIAPHQGTVLWLVDAAAAGRPGSHP